MGETIFSSTFFHTARTHGAVVTIEKQGLELLLSLAAHLLPPFSVNRPARMKRTEWF